MSSYHREATFLLSAFWCIELVLLGLAWVVEGAQRLAPSMAYAGAFALVHVV